MYEIIDSMVYKVLPYGRELIGNENMIILESNKYSILADGIDFASITPKYQKFDTNQGAYIDYDTTEEIELDVGGQVIVTNVGEPIEFTSENPGQCIIKAINEGAGSIGVVIDAIMGEVSTLEEQIYAENLYQTALLEINMLGGM